MRFPAQQRRLLDNLPAALTLLRGLVNDDDFMAEIAGLALERHADGFATYKSAMYSKSSRQLRWETAEEIADALVYLSEVAAQERTA